MKLPPPKAAKSPARKLLDFVSCINDRLRWVFIAPAPKRGRRIARNARLGRHSLLAAQALEARLLLTGPTANADTYYDANNGTINIAAYAGVLANDTGGNGPLSAVLVSQPSYGTVTLNSDGSLLYTNTTMTSMDDTFTYEAYDGSTYSSPATVSVMFMDNYQPQANGGMYSIKHGNTLTVSAANGVLAGDSDPNHLHLTAVVASNPSDGSLSLNSDGSLTYTPRSNFAGDDSFEYEAYDGNFYSSPAFVQIDVTETPPMANNDNYSLLNSQTLNVSAANGVLANDSGDSPLTATLYSQPQHGSLTLNADGSFDYTPASGWIGADSFQYTASDGVSTTSPATVTLNTQYGIVSAVDQTKVPVDTIQVSNQILSDPFNSPVSSPLPAGGSGGTTISAAPADGAPATAHNLALIYNSVSDQVIEADVGLSLGSGTSDTLSAALTFNGVAQPTVYFNMNSLNGSDPQVHIAMQVVTSGLSSGRYPYSLTINGGHVASPVTLSGAVNVVNDSASPFGKGWDMPGLLRLFNNTVSGVPNGVLLSSGGGGADYYTENEDGSYSSPAGPYAFSTLTSVGGGGWQLVTHDGVAFNFNSSGYLTSRVERTGETTTYTWSAGELTAITDEFGRTVPLSYSGGLLASIGDFLGNTWTIAHSGSNLTSITEPDPGGGSPVWQYAYSGNYMSSETDPNGNQSSFTLDSFHRLSGTALPGGASTSDTSEQDFGYGSTNSSSPASLTMQTSVTPAGTDANGNQSSYQTDQFGDPISETDAYGSVETIQRDANGLPTQITLPPPATGGTAPVTNISYTTTGDETSATGAQPTYGTYTYTANSFGQWATFTDTTGDEWVRTFDSQGNILTESDPSGAEVSWTYNTYGQPLTMTLPAPNDGSGTVTVDYHYDTDDRLTEIVWPDNSNEQFGFNADDRETTYQDENGHITATALDVLGRVVSVTNAAGGVTSTTYDKDSNVLTTTDAMVNVTTNEWNSQNELVQQTLPPPVTGGPSPVLAFTYDANGNELTSTDALGRVTSETWDKLNRMVTQTLPAPAQGQPAPTTTLGYDNDSRKVSEQNALGGTTTWAYANADISQVTSETLPAQSGSGSGSTTSYFYDADGRQDQVENALDQFTTTAFTVNGQTASVKDNLGDAATDNYGNSGELLSTTDPLSHISSDEYDSRYRLVQTTDANAGVTQITLDPAGNRTKLVDPAGNATTWTYSPVNLPLTETNALGTTTTTYNLDSLATSIEDADGRVRDFVYNNDQQLTAENWMSGNTIVAAMAYSYDLAGELSSASDPNSAYAFAYNGDGDVTTVDNAGTPNVPHVVLASGYDALGDRTSLAATIAGTADFLNNYSYNGDQQLTAVTQQDQNGGNIVSPKEIDYDYNPLGQVTDTWAYNTLGGPREDVLHGATTYDSDARLTGLAYTSNAGADTIDAFGWAYNAANLVTTFTSIDGTAAYGYDPTNQLTSATYTTASGGHQPANESYSYNLNGSRTNAGYSASSDNLISSDGTFNYQHDADGNTTVRTRISNAYATDYKTTYSWDYRNRLTDVEYYDNNSVLTKHVHYVYDVFNDLIGEEDDDTGSGSYDNQQWYVEGDTPQIPTAGLPSIAMSEPLLVFNTSGSLVQRNLVAPDPAGMKAVMAQEAVSSTNEGGPTIYMVDDNLGTVRDDVDATGTEVNHAVFSSAGEQVYQSNSSIVNWNSFAGGHRSVATMLIIEGLRWDDPGINAWLSEDPFGFRAGDPNLSRVVGNDPTNAIDPSGLEPWNPYWNPNLGPTSGMGSPNGSWTIAEFYSAMSAQQMAYAAQVGCFALMLMRLNICPPNPTSGQNGSNPITAQGMNWFGSYAAAQKFQTRQWAAGMNATIVAYQFIHAGGPWTPPTPGAMTAKQVQAVAPGPGAGNWATLMRSKPSRQWYWEYMNHANPDAMVFHEPFNGGVPNLGIAPGRMNSTVYTVYVPPAPVMTTPPRP